MMIPFGRLSAGPTLPDLIRQAANAQAAAVSRPLPLAAWCRGPVLVALREQECPVLTWHSTPPFRQRLRNADQGIMMRGYVTSAMIMLAAAHLLLDAGLMRARDARMAFRWSSRLTAKGMGLWRRGRSRVRP
jgi:hypothetical protein